MTQPVFPTAAWVTIVVASLAGIALINGVVRTSMRAARPRWIVKRLVKTGAPVTLTMGWIASAQAGFWDPGYAGPEPVFHQIYEVGTGTYTLDDAGIVHLRLVQRDGHIRVRSGPVPHPVEPAGAHRTGRRLTWLAVGAYALCLSLGATIGALMAGGNANHRLVGAFIGGILGFLVGWALLLAFAVGRSASAVAHHPTEGGARRAEP